jgi:hypothetical protein
MISMGYYGKKSLIRQLFPLFPVPYGIASPDAKVRAQLFVVTGRIAQAPTCNDRLTASPCCEAGEMIFSAVK